MMKFVAVATLCLIGLAYGEPLPEGEPEGLPGSCYYCTYTKYTFFDKVLTETGKSCETMEGVPTHSCNGPCYKSIIDKDGLYLIERRCSNDGTSKCGASHWDFNVPKDGIYYQGVTHCCDKGDDCNGASVLTAALVLPLLMALFSCSI